MEVPFELVPLSPWTFHPAKQTLAIIGLFGESYFWYLHPIIGSANVLYHFAAIEVVVGPHDYSFPPLSYSTKMRSPLSVPDLRLLAAQTVVFPYVGQLAALPLDVVEGPVVEATSVLVKLGLQIEAAGGPAEALGGPWHAAD